MSTTYSAVEVTRPGLLQLTQRPLKEPTAGQVRIRVEACGVCHSDSATVDGVLPGITFPRVPGHEVVGKIDAIGPGVSGWKIGQRVGPNEIQIRDVTKIERVVRDERIDQLSALISERPDADCLVEPSGRYHFPGGMNRDRIEPVQRFAKRV